VCIRFELVGNAINSLVGVRTLEIRQIALDIPFGDNRYAVCIQNFQNFLKNLIVLFIHFYYQLGLFGYFVVNALTVELTMYMRTVQRTTADKSVQCNNDRIVYVFQQIVSNGKEENESEKDGDSAVDNESGSESECDK
jgi:hypothetical protein